MPEGYTGPSKMMDWSGLANNVATKIGEVTSERQAQKDALDASARELTNTISNSEMGASQTMNGLVLDGVDKGKMQIKKWNDQLKAGQLSPKDYKTKLTNLQDYWATFANSTKTYDDRYKLAVARQTPDENGKIPGSGFELEMVSKYGQTAELNGKSLQIGDDGTVNMTSIDPNTGEVTNVINVLDINRPENMIDDRVDVSDQVDGFIKNWEPDTLFEDLGRGAERTITTLKGRPQYEIMKSKVAETIASDSNPRAQLSVLIDNGVMEAHFYDSPKDKEAARQEEIARQKQILRTANQPEELTEKQLKDIDFGLVEVARDANGVYNPVLTEDQKKAAKERVKEDIDVKMSTKITGQGRAVFSPNSGGGGKDEDGIAGWDMTQKIFSSAVPVGKTSGTDNNSSLLSSLASKNPGLKFKKVKWKSGVEGVAIMKYVKDNKGGKWVDFINITNPRDLAPYIYGTSNIDKSLNTWDAANAQGGGTPKQVEVPTASKGDWKAAGWSDAQIAQGVKEGKIKLN